MEDKNQLSLAMKFLEKLEVEESGLLAWGLVNASFSYDEIKEKAETFLEINDPDGSFNDEYDLLDYLENKALIFRLPSVNKDLYRTRMAESIRLLSRLRQLFPKHNNEILWQTAPTLVADYRFIRRPRAYPERSIDTQKAIKIISTNNNFSSLQNSLIEKLLKLSTEHPINLAGFQLRSTESILSGIYNSGVKGTIICAGTGSGKTLAFYLPAFLHIAKSISHNPSSWVRCLAIYPRNELLKDQFSDTYMQARMVNEVLENYECRKLKIGAFFGSTPNNNYSLSRKNKSLWKRVSNGYVCPYLRCPNQNCEGDLIWLDEDLKNKIERLVCHNPNCSNVIEQDEVILTRERIIKSPPDILFTTTEMLNQRLSDSKYNHLFGVGKNTINKPDLILLDEVHTYSGIHGAQVALLLRRWKQAAKCFPHFVGLSATLKEAKSFFSSLTGIYEKYVDDISPKQKELIKEGTEYLVALRGDPVSRASLLSTTIQTGMLARRILDTQEGNISKGVYGKKVFIFTDDLDVTNRLYFNLLDSEGRNSWCEIDPKKNGSLATLRNPNIKNSSARFLDGQSWNICQKIGFSLDNDDRLHIGRTSSQDAGVLSDADIIVASASLEVGFNDSDVGTIIQHKAPRNSSQFLQRKGRAGRKREMRPWTIVVLSDYGRDRIAYQGYDLLFDPEIDPIDIPIANRYVLKMQAAYSFMDWIASKLDDAPSGSVWQDFASPWQTIDSRFPIAYKNNIKKRQKKSAQIIKEVLTKEESLNDLASYLEKALKVDSDTINSLLWDPPRALITSVLPTIFRRLNSGWLKNSEFGKDYIVANNPLPEFIPQSLFSDLNLPEVTILTPPQQKGEKEREDSLSIFQALKEFAPGRISKRFGLSHKFARHWIAPQILENTVSQDLPITQYCPSGYYDELGYFQFLDNGSINNIRCIRVHKLIPQVPNDKNIRENSNAFLDWRSQFIPIGKGMVVDLPKPSKWKNIFKEIRFFSHNHHCPIEVRRFALGSNATITRTDGDSFNTYIRFIDDSSGTIEPVSTGYILDVDGIMFRIKIPNNFHFNKDDLNKTKLRALRVNRFNDLIVNANELNEITNKFQREWIAQIYSSALIFKALQSNTSLENAFNKIRNEDTSLRFSEVLNVIFQSIITDEVRENLSDEHTEKVSQNNHEELRMLLSNQKVLNVLYSHTPILWMEPDKKWDNWLSNKFKVTLGAALLEAIQSLCPDISIDDLILDTNHCPDPRFPLNQITSKDEEVIWITETTIGGGGIIEKLLSKYGENPRRFFDLLENSLDASDFELMDNQLTVFLDLICNKDDSELQNILTEIRKPNTLTELTTAFVKLIQSTVKRGLIASHPVIAAINSRILRPGSSAETDLLINNLIQDWSKKEKNWGIEIDPRVFAYLKSQTNHLDKSLNQLEKLHITSEQDLRQWRFGVIYSLLWPRGSIIRSQRLSAYNPFDNLPKTERLLVLDSLEDKPNVVDIENEGWEVRYEEYLKQKGIVILRCSTNKPSLLKVGINYLMVNPIDDQFLFFYPRIRGIKRTHDNILITLEIAESIQ